MKRKKRKPKPKRGTVRIDPRNVTVYRHPHFPPRLNVRHAMVVLP